MPFRPGSLTLARPRKHTDMQLPVSWATRRGLRGPWPCDACGQISQYAEVSKGVNRVFCRNPQCLYVRIIDKRRGRIIENDGTCWEFDDAGNKRQVRMRI